MVKIDAAVDPAGDFGGVLMFTSKLFIRASQAARVLLMWAEEENCNSSRYRAYSRLNLPEQVR